MKAIGVVDKNWGIGKNNRLLFHIKEDLNYFHRTTYGKVVVMGSSTFKSLPGGKPLKSRINIILNPEGEQRDDCIVVKTLEELAAKLKEYDTDNVYIIGGGMFYHTMLPFCESALITKVDTDGKAEVFFDDLDKLGWQLRVSDGPYETESGHKITYCTYYNPDLLTF